MNREEFLALEDNNLMAAKLNELVEAGKTADEAKAEFGLTPEDMRKENIFFVRGKFMARAWSGYTTTKRTGNELGDTANGVGGSDPSLGYNGI